MNYLKRLISVVALLAVAACGGGGGNPGDPITGPGSGSGSVTDIVLVLSAQQVTSTSGDTVTATATTVDSNRNAVANVPLVISVDANAVVSTTATSTDTTGRLVATIGIGSDRTSRTVTVTAKAGNLTRTATFAVVPAVATESASDLVLVLSSATISNSGTGTITATATALDAKRNALPNVAVVVTVDSGAVVTSPSKVTGTNGTVVATIGIGSDRSNRDIIVTAQTGTIVRSTVLKVATDPGTPTPVASDMALVISAPSVTNGGSETVVATATAVDQNRNVVAGIPITFSVDSGATAAVTGTVTDINGQIKATVGIGADRSNRSIAVTATTGNITRTVNFVVTGAKLSSSAAPLVGTNSVGNRIEYTLVDFNAIPMVGQTIIVTADGLTRGEGKTDLNGKYTYTYTAPSTAQVLLIKADSANVTRTDNVTVSAGPGTIPDADSALFATVSASLTPTPNVVTVNTAGSQTNQVELRALFVANGNKPVPNVRVRFDLADNLNNTDGTVSWVGGPSAVAYSDANGIARATFTPGQRSSPTNGITVRACFDSKDFVGGAVGTACTFTGARVATSTLTVSSEALSVNIRTNALIKAGPADLTYIKEYVVMVVDSAGQAKADVQITPSVDLTAYYKGFWVWDGIIYRRIATLASDEYWRWADPSWVKTAAPDSLTPPSCPNEDVNRNGVRDANAFDPFGTAPTFANRREDLNWNGEIDPRKADVAVKMVGSSKTDANGLAILQIEYGKNLATWVDYVITVTASGVAGTEARARFPGNLPFPSTRHSHRVPAAGNHPQPLWHWTLDRNSIGSRLRRDGDLHGRQVVSFSLVGMPGSGKSTVGRHLARHLGLDFADSDAEIERRIGMPIRDWFQQHGEESFRDLEQEVIDDLTSSNRVVLATGGGAVLRPSNRDALHSRTHVVYLKSSPEELFRRLRHDTQRPLLQVADPLNKLRELFRERDPLYRRVAHFVIEAARPSVPALMDMVLMQLDLAGLLPTAGDVGRSGEAAAD